MRATILAVSLLLGVMVMNATAQDKKDDPPKKGPILPPPTGIPTPKLDEKATLRAWDDSSKEFLKATELESKFRIGTNGFSDYFMLGGRNIHLPIGKPTRGSEITDLNGKVWIVTHVNGGKNSMPYACDVKPKP